MFISVICKGDLMLKKILEETWELFYSKQTKVQLLDTIFLSTKKSPYFFNLQENVQKFFLLFSTVYTAMCLAVLCGKPFTVQYTKVYSIMQEYVFTV